MPMMYLNEEKILQFLIQTYVNNGINIIFLKTCLAIIWNN